jgi:hypothetical protein
MRLKVKCKPFGIGDTFVCLAWLTTVAKAGLGIAQFRMGALGEDVSISLAKGFDGTNEEKSRIIQV